MAQTAGVGGWVEGWRAVQHEGVGGRSGPTAAVTCGGRTGRGEQAGENRQGRTGVDRAYRAGCCDQALPERAGGSTGGEETRGSRPWLRAGADAGAGAHVPRCCCSSRPAGRRGAAGRLGGPCSAARGARAAQAAGGWGPGPARAGRPGQQAVRGRPGWGAAARAHQGARTAARVRDDAVPRRWTVPPAGRWPPGRRAPPAWNPCARTPPPAPRRASSQKLRGGRAG